MTGIFHRLQPPMSPHQPTWDATLKSQQGAAASSQEQPQRAHQTLPLCHQSLVREIQGCLVRAVLLQVVKMLCHPAGKKDHVEITTGKGGLPMVVLKHACGSKAEVRLSSNHGRKAPP